MSIHVNVLHMIIEYTDSFVVSIYTLEFEGIHGLKISQIIQLGSLRIRNEKGTD